MKLVWRCLKDDIGFSSCDLIFGSSKQQTKTSRFLFIVAWVCETWDEFNWLRLRSMEFRIRASVCACESLENKVTVIITYSTYMVRQNLFRKLKLVLKFNVWTWQTRAYLCHKAFRHGNYANKLFTTHRTAQHIQPHIHSERAW